MTNAGARSKAEEPSRLEPLILDLLARFLDVPEAQIDSEIEDAIRRIAEFLGLDQGFLLQWGEDRTRPLPIHSWTAPGSSPLQPFPGIDVIPWVHRQSTLGKIVMFSRVEDLPQEADNGLFPEEREKGTDLAARENRRQGRRSPGFCEPES